ncbi:MAG: PIG-L deacetylase family protein [Ktedonobacterales bacterium]
MQLTSLDQINRQFRHIYFQPHFDDGALSCGGAIALQVATGQQVLVVTIFGGIPSSEVALSPFAAQVQQQMGLGLDGAEAVRSRRAEDTAAAETLGASVLWLDYLDAVYRGSPAFYQDEESLFGPVNAGDLSLDEELAGVFMSIHERAPLAAIYAPLGIGHHVDHQLCCSAADRLAQRKLNVKFYEDFPYVAQSASALGLRQQELSLQMEPELVEISGVSARKEEAISQYASQIPSLFGNGERLHKMLADYSSSLRRTYPGIQIERYWRW